MTNLKIKVTKEILMKAANCSYDVGKNCAVALAVRDIFPLADVSGVCIYPFGCLNKTSILDSISLPKNARTFILKFDKGNPLTRPSMPEIEFEINIPDAVIEKINIDEIRPLLVNHPTLELV